MDGSQRPGILLCPPCRLELQPYIITPFVTIVFYLNLDLGDQTQALMHTQQTLYELSPQP